MDFGNIDVNQIITTLGASATLLVAACFYIWKLLGKIDEIQDERIVEVKGYAEKLHFILDKVNNTMEKLVEKLEKQDGTK